MKPIWNKTFAFVITALSAAYPAHAQESRPPALDFPLACTIGKDCFVQYYVDMKPGKGAADYRCGSLAKNDHKGADIRIRTLADMAKGVSVIAAASGKVVNIRRGVKDQYFSDYSKKKKKEIYAIGLGNVVVIDHGDGWESYYAHMKQGSIKVVKGQRIEKGDVLGSVGMSGLTDFPHVHFEVRYNRTRMDPFSGAAINSGCDLPDNPYWSEKTLKTLTYTPTFFVNTGFSEIRPANRKDLESGKKKQNEISSMAPTLFFWSYYIGSRKGDKVRLKMTGPNGKTVATYLSKPMGSNQISRYIFVGAKRPAGGWAAGTYKGKISVIRRGKTYEDAARIFVTVRG